MIDWDSPEWGNRVHEASDGSWTHAEVGEEQ